MTPFAWICRSPAASCEITSHRSSPVVSRKTPLSMASFTVRPPCSIANTVCAESLKTSVNFTMCWLAGSATINISHNAISRLLSAWHVASRKYLSATTLPSHLLVAEHTLPNVPSPRLRPSTYALGDVCKSKATIAVYFVCKESGAGAGAV